MLLRQPAESSRRIAPTNTDTRDQTNANFMRANQSVVKASSKDQPFLWMLNHPYLVTIFIPQLFGSLVLFLTENHPGTNTRMWPKEGPLRLAGGSIRSKSEQGL